MRVDLVIPCFDTYTPDCVQQLLDRNWPPIILWLDASRIGRCYWPWCVRKASLPSQSSLSPNVYIGPATSQSGVDDLGLLLVAARYRYDGEGAGLDYFHGTQASCRQIWSGSYGCILRYRKMISMISRCGGYGDIGVLWETGSRLTRRTAI